MRAFTAPSIPLTAALQQHASLTCLGGAMEAGGVAGEGEEEEEEEEGGG